MAKKLKNLQIVIFKNPPKNFKDKYPFKGGEALLFLGEIQNMPGHCVVANKEGKVFWGYHTDNFRQPKESEI